MHCNLAATSAQRGQHGHRSREELVGARRAKDNRLERVERPLVQVTPSALPACRLCFHGPLAHCWGEGTTQPCLGGRCGRRRMLNHFLRRWNTSAMASHAAWTERLPWGLSRGLFEPNEGGKLRESQCLSARRKIWSVRSRADRRSHTGLSGNLAVSR